MLAGWAGSGGKLLWFKYPSPATLSVMAIQAVAGYLREVFMQYYKRLTGGSILLISSGVIERFVTKSVSWEMYSWLLTACFVSSLIQHGVAQQKRLMPRLAIRKLEYSEWPFPTFGKTGRGYHFSIENLSEAESLEQVNANIIAVEPPLQYFTPPVPMKVRNKDYIETPISLNPLSSKQIDLLTGPSSDSRSQREMFIIHVVKDFLKPVPIQRYRITVQVDARNIRPATAIFEAWVDEKEGLKCMLL